MSSSVAEKSKGACMIETYCARRERLAQCLPENCGMLLFSGEELPMGVDMTYPFSVNRNFYWSGSAGGGTLPFTGGAAAVSSAVGPKA